MRTPAQIAGHPIHPMLVPIPIGLWLFSLVCDFVAMRSGSPGSWATASFYAMIGGIIGALAAALPGLVDLLGTVRKTAVRSTGFAHMGLNLLIVALYAINAWMRRGDTTVAPSGTPLLLSVIGILLLLVSGWLGGKMVYEAGIAVHAEDMAMATARDRAVPERTGGTWGSMGTGLGRDHAMASETRRPAREPMDRPSAGGSSGSPRD